jgi:hypothetical protein
MLGVLTNSPTYVSTLPAGAAALGYTAQAIYIAPDLADISFAPGTTKLYSGLWYESPVPDPSHYSMTNGVLTLSLLGSDKVTHATLCTQQHNSKQGALPYLLLGNGIYAECAMRLSQNNDGDQISSFWLMPQEHNYAAPPGHPADYQPSLAIEQWGEFDVFEGGRVPGYYGNWINWSGMYPNYKSVDNHNPWAVDLDLTVEHIFGISIDPIGQQVAWYVDGVMVGKQSTSTLPAVVLSYHYYLVIGLASRGANVPYSGFFRYLAAFTAPVSA